MVHGRMHIFLTMEAWNAEIISSAAGSDCARDSKVTEDDTGAAGRCRRYEQDGIVKPGERNL